MGLQGVRCESDDSARYRRLRSLVRASDWQLSQLVLYSPLLSEPGSGRWFFREERAPHDRQPEGQSSDATREPFSDLGINQSLSNICIRKDRRKMATNSKELVAKRS